MLEHPEIAVLVGRGGQGKSTLARHWLAGRKRVIVNDPKMEPDAAVGRHIANTPTELVALIEARAFNVCYRAWRGIDPIESFEFVNRAALAVGDCTVLWEEVDLFTPRGRLPRYAYELVNQGRHDGVRLIACARRALRVSRDLTASATRIVCFQTTEPRDVRYLEEFIGAAADQVRTLPQWHALDWQERAGASVRAAPFT